MHERVIFTAALNQGSSADRAAFLDKACGVDAGLRQRVESLLLEHEQLGSFLDFSSPAATLDLPTEEPGTLIGPYKLLEQIGEGGMGIVYVAEQSEPVRRRVALKIIKPGMDTKQVIARFEAERQALAMMEHPNIAKILDAGTTGQAASASGWWLAGEPKPSPALATSTSHSIGRPYFAMELVRGLPITDYCDKARLTPRQRLELFIDVCHAVQHAHQKGVIHRDLKPSNVMITVHDGQAMPKVIDFGVAKAVGQQLTDRTVYTAHTQLIGTPLYMSPEQADVSSSDVDTRSDVYSLGVLLYELLTGTTPFDKERLKSVGFDEMRRIIREEEPETVSQRISRTRTDHPGASTGAKFSRRVHAALPELDWIVAKALEKDRTRRYESPSALAADIQRYLDDEAVHACPPSLAYRLRKTARRYQAALITAGLLAAALVLGTFISVWQAARATHGFAQAKANETRALAAEAAERTARQAEAAERQRAEAEAERAKSEATIAQAINKFVTDDLLEQASPDLEPDRSLQLRAVLDRAGTKIGDRFQDQPLVQASIRATLGRAYLSLGSYTAAEPHLVRAHALRVAALGDEHPLALESAIQLGDLRDEQSRLAEAEQVYSAAYSRCRQKLGDTHAVTMSALFGLASVAEGRGQFSRAQLLYEQILDVRQRHLGEGHPATLQAMRRHASMHVWRGQYRQAEPIVLRALETHRRVLGSDNPATLKCRYNLAQLYHRQYRLAESRAIFDELVALQSQVLGEEHPGTLETLYALAQLHTTAGRFVEAEQLHAKVLDVRRRVLGDDHPRTLASLTGVATSPGHRNGRIKEGEAFWKDWLERVERVEGPEHPDLFHSMATLGYLYRVQRRWAEAEPLLTQAVAGLRRTQGNEAKYTTGAINQLALLYYDQRRFGEAESLFQELLDIHLRESGEEFHGTQNTMNALALCYLGQGRLTESVALLEKAVELNRQFMGEHPDRLASLNNLAGAYREANRLDEAESLYHETLQLQLRVLGDNDRWTLTTMNNLALLYSRQGRYDEARKLYQETLGTKRRTLGNEHQETISGIINLAALYDKTKDHGAAEPLFREALEIRQKLLGPEHPDTLVSMAFLGINLNYQRRYDDAEPLLRQAVAAGEKTAPNDHTTFNRQSHLGGALLGQACNLKATGDSAAEPKFCEAERWLAAGYEGLKAAEAKIPADAKHRTTDALQRLVELYTAWNKPDLAAKWQAELDDRTAKPLE